MSMVESVRELMVLMVVVRRRLVLVRVAGVVCGWKWKECVNVVLVMVGRCRRLVSLVVVCCLVITGVGAVGREWSRLRLSGCVGGTYGGRSVESDGEGGISRLRGKERVVSKVTCLRCGLCMSASCGVVGGVWILTAGVGCECVGLLLKVASAGLSVEWLC